jgi:cell wall-associated NlpC family hydrolase
MGSDGRGGWRVALAAATGAVALLAICPFNSETAIAAGSTGSAGSSSTTPSTSATSSSTTSSSTTSSTTTSLPAVPAVSPSITDGQSAQALLSNAVTLLSVGVDSTAQQAAIAATAQQLDVDAVTAQKLTQAANQADVKATAELSQARQAEQVYRSLDTAVKDAVLFLYTVGPTELKLNPGAGNALAYAIDYADTAITPGGILANRAHDARVEHRALAAAQKTQKAADEAAARAAQALAAESAAGQRLEAEVAAVDAASAAEVAADHAALAAQAGNELLSATSLQFTPKVAVPASLVTTPIALAWAFAELGKPYEWGATGPDTFDCSGLTQFVWGQAGVSIPRVAADQDAWTIPMPLSQLLPGDLVFYGQTDIHHVGIYIGDGLMINAPHTGDVVRVSSIWWSDLAGFGRVHAAGVPVPLHQPPTLQQPATPAVVPVAGPVPSQTKPPKGWNPKPGSTTPISINPEPAQTVTTTAPPPSTTTTTTTTTVPATTTTTSSGGSSPTDSTTTLAGPSTP